jgi:23S rRNA G2445 N2-methylase RlmL
MKKESQNPGKELYKQLRKLPWEELWSGHAARFNAATPPERVAQAGLIRALGVVAAEAGTPEQRRQTREWLLQLLRDPEEKVRRYAMAALPKLRAGQEGETALLEILGEQTSEREKRHMGRALDKIGGAATLQRLRGEGVLPAQTEQKIKAHVARSGPPASVRLDAVITDIRGLRVHLRGRKGLEVFVRDEFLAHPGLPAKFKLLETAPGWVALAPQAPFALQELYSLRCFGSVGLVLGLVKASEHNTNEAIAQRIAAPPARRLFRVLTEGMPRYRLEFAGQGSRSGAVREVANRAYALCPDLLNDAKQATWSVDIFKVKPGWSVELRPRLSPDPRYFYRVDDVPAASHPPLASSMARLAGRMEGEVIWDPFCGSGLELIESALLGGVRRLIGTDLEEKAARIARMNLQAARLEGVDARILCQDFRKFREIKELAPGQVSLILTNPPLGRRVRIPDMRGLFADLFGAAAAVLRPGGRLVFANPLKMDSPDPSLALDYRKPVDLGGFECRLEKWVKCES